MTITLYSKPSCVACDATKRKFDKSGLSKTDYVEVDISKDADALAFARGLDPAYAQAPIVLVQRPDGSSVHWAGYSPDSIERYITKELA